MIIRNTPRWLLTLVGILIAVVSAAGFLYLNSGSSYKTADIDAAGPWDITNIELKHNQLIQYFDSRGYNQIRAFGGNRSQIAYEKNYYQGSPPGIRVEVSFTSMNYNLNIRAIEPKTTLSAFFDDDQVSNIEDLNQMKADIVGIIKK